VTLVVVLSLPGILLLAFVAGRLLGARRSLGATLLSGLVGWAAGVGLSLVIASNHVHRSAGFARNVWVFSAVFTMSATVWMELLARPGALARAQTGLVNIPRPLRALRRRGRRVGRYAQITRIVVRHGLGPSIGLASRRSHGDLDGTELDAGESRLPPAVRLRRALEDCGGMFVKLGQLLSTRSDLVPDDVARELARLQDHVGPADPREVRLLLEAELGGPVTDVFAEFEWEPLAAASIGQAHRARLRDGQPVIVKVQRPGIAESVARDLEVLDELARVAETRTTWGRDYGVVELAGEFGQRLREELDFGLEARNATELAADLGCASPVRVPRVVPEFSSTRVLVMEWFDGVSVRDHDAIDGIGADRRALADTLLRCMLHQMLVQGRFHADPHPGNVMVLADGGLGLVDFGAVGRLDPLQQAALRDLMVAVARRDAEQLRTAVLGIATVRGRVDEEQLERALARFMARHLAAGSAPSAAMFNDLLQLFFTFGIRVPAELSTFFRALVTLEGTLTTLAPGYLALEAAQGIAAEWARERLTPATLEEVARDELIRAVPTLRRLPRHVDRIATLAERGQLGLRVSLLSEPDDVVTVTRLVNRVVLAFLGALVGVLSVMLLGTTGGPPFAGTTSLFQFFGYFGLFCATVLILRVIVAVLHDGLN
jgi:ubiquinone biosynthesis protein